MDKVAGKTGAPQDFAGKYAQKALAKAGVTVHPVSLEESVKGVITKVSLREADAGIVYVTDVLAAGSKVVGVQIPAGQNVTTKYPIAPITGSANAATAQAFVDFVLSPAGQQVLTVAGFTSP